MLLSELKQKLEATNYSDLKATLDGLGFGDAFEVGKKKASIIQNAVELFEAKNSIVKDTINVPEVGTDVPEVEPTVTTPPIETGEGNQGEITNEQIESSLAIYRLNLAQCSDAQRESLVTQIAKLEAMKK